MRYFETDMFVFVPEIQPDPHDAPGPTDHSVDAVEVNQLASAFVELDDPDSQREENRGGDDVDVPDCLIWDLDSAGVTQSHALDIETFWAV